ncbi:helix-turn-helix domain-containing protein [Paeniglutamicibacter cryotolerans]|uniref:Uncharacterized protein n=1 Tax=Paeniglutamicibacter cryotolerans TaxID=670079 RepID=A0A839QGF3_9MICC|nr:helix-turn-helix domain-containing protein [Paeniglutamicibacter cryotolerans]MBB2994693.1 hypothetical protein [Paeniglutamicibacter cryotolerans]
MKVRTLEPEEEAQLLQIVRRSTGSVVTWRRAHLVLLSTRDLDVAVIAEVAFTSVDPVHDVLHDFTDDGFDSRHPKYAGGRPPKFSPEQRDLIKQVALGRPADDHLPFPPGTCPHWPATSSHRGGGRDFP